MTDHAKKLTELLGEWPEGSPQRAALLAGIAGLSDTASLDKAERMNIDTDIALCGPSEWVAFDPFGDILARGTNIRECIDEAPE